MGIFCLSSLFLLSTGILFSENFPSFGVLFQTYHDPLLWESLEEIEDTYQKDIDQAWDKVNDDMKAYAATKDKKGLAKLYYWFAHLSLILNLQKNN